MRPTPGSHVFQRAGTIFELNAQKNTPLPGGHFFSPIWTIFELVRDINKTTKTAPPTGCHVLQPTGNTFELHQHIIKTNILTNFELDRGIIATNLLTKFHEDQTRNVASRVFTNQMWSGGRTDDGQRPIANAKTNRALKHLLLK
ncbi:hypothetical protein DPMN_133515 [Dreissena polymorpha]|uniref:Uncharacterized protein n=1 Tax=Dreissena polymorpha TaxID=45954 RepID=A0A9D4JE23_DREPO|nr:hypothetical protein DPMN_133515 [Dreissena polymorpha]